MGDVIPFQSRPHITTGSRRDNLSRKNAAQAVAFASLPGWVVADKKLNHDCVTLMQAGWRFEVALENHRKVYFSHPNVNTVPPRLIDSDEALQIQGIFDRGQS